MRVTFLSFFWFVLGCGILILITGLIELRWVGTGECNRNAAPEVVLNENCNSPVYVVYGHNVESGFLNHVFETFESFGFKRGSLSSPVWHILWAHDYPFRVLKSQLQNLQRFQKVNHFPGTGFITNKLDLAKTESQYIPKAFEMPKQKESLLKYVRENPKKVFVQKSNDHRGIRIEKMENLDLNTADTFVQEFIGNPLLIDGYKFDIGIYTIITSIEPLRVYIYNGDILFRFCPVKYFPFDPTDRNKYVVGDNYLPLWQVPSLQKYFSELGYSMRDSFNAYMRAIGRHPEVMWTRIEDAIRRVILLKESKILRLVKNYASKRNFFEMVRFDFAVDDEMNVFIMEANMSPNLSSAHFPPNKLMYYQVLFNLFSLVGLSNYNQRLKDNMAVSLKNLMVFPEHCATATCNTCYSSLCQLCLKCLSREAIEYLKETYVEHNNRQDCKRIFPVSFIDDQFMNETISNYSPDNQLLSQWFRGKCALDKSWC